MNVQPFDPEMYKVAQPQERNDVAPNVGRWWRVVYEAPLVPVANRMIELAEIQPGDRVPDVATGLGEPALTAAAAVGVTGHVTATDISAEMLRIASERAAQSGLTNLDFGPSPRPTVRSRGPTACYACRPRASLSGAGERQRPDPSARR